jgi:hypothetical protein
MLYIAGERPRKGSIAMTMSKQTLLMTLLHSGVAWATVEYDGCGDEGRVNEISLFRSSGELVTSGRATRVPGRGQASLEAEVEDFVESQLYERFGSWGDNEGSTGTVEIDVNAGTVKFDHGWYETVVEPAPFEV